MSKNIWKKKQTSSLSKKVLLPKPNLKIITEAFLAPVTISQEILNKIKYLCMEIPKVEWSGILFYKVVGSITKPASFECIITDILPMDMGSKTYTEYQFDQTVADYIEQDDERFDWKIGHIHSHNTMKTYFSGTDMSELNDNSEFHNYYLSLIVNNFMDMTAKIAYRATTEGFSYKAIDENGNSYSKNLQIKQTYLVIHDCVINVPTEEISISKEFADRVAHIKKPKKVDKRIGFNSVTVGSDWDIDKDLNWDIKDNQLSLDIEKISNHFDFTKCLLRLGTKVSGDSVENAIDDLYSQIGGEEQGIKAVKQMAEEYEDLFDYFFQGKYEYYSQDSLEILQKVLKILQEYADLWSEEEDNEDPVWILINLLKEKHNEIEYYQSEV